MQTGRGPGRGESRNCVLLPSRANGIIINYFPSTKKSQNLNAVSLIITTSEVGTWTFPIACEESITQTATACFNATKKSDFPVYIVAINSKKHGLLMVLRFIGY